MNEFTNYYKETINLFDEGTFEDETWRSNLTNNLLMLNQLWPDEEVEQLAFILNDWNWRVFQIKKWSELDQKTIEEELYNHGSLFFFDVKHNFTEEEENNILENFWKLTSSSKNPKSTAIFNLFSGKLKHVNKVEKVKKIKSEQEIIIDDLNKIKKHYWNLLLECAKEWEIDDRLILVLKDLSKPNSRIKAKDKDYFIDTLKYLIEKNYIFRIEDTNKTNLTKKLTFNSIIDAIKNA